MKPIRIGHISIPVTYSDDVPQNLLGMFTSNPDPEILISKDIKGSMTGFQTVLHEAIHAVSHFYGGNLTEEQVFMLDMALTSLIRENQHLIKALQK